MPDPHNEPDRYELREPPAYQFTPTRREAIALLGAGVLITVPALAQRGAETAGARLHVGDDGIVTVLTGKVEVGQGARTEIAMAAAEELGLPLARVRVLMADTDAVPDDGITAGSRTTPSTLPAVRRAAAAARQWLASGKARLDDAVIPPDVALKRVDEWRILGQSHPQTHARDIVTGRHQFPSDIRRPGMLYGAVLRPPAYGATLEWVDKAAAAKVPGVVAVHDGAFAGCAAPSLHAARQGVEALATGARWQRGEHPASAEMAAYLKKTAKPPRTQNRGAVEEAMAAAARRHSATYFVPYIQHAPMEPRAAVAEWSEGKLTVWTGTQNPHGVRGQLAQAFNLPTARVRVIVPDAGGGFGGKHTGEVAIEAARLARESGKPVSLRWPRGDEFTWAYFRPAGLFEAAAGLDAEGRITAWDFSTYNAGTAGIESPYRGAVSRTRFHETAMPVRQGSYRGIAATTNNFARECFVDELAELAGRDPLEFRLAHLENDRLRAVLTVAAEKFGWASRRKGTGIACGVEKGSYVAACAELEGGAIRRLHMAYECGAILNPANLRAQVVGSIIQGLGGALTEEARFTKGILETDRFSRYRVPRFRDVPPIEVHLVDRRDLNPVGAGETPIIAVAPAIANAAFHLTGDRLRSLPLRWKA